MHLLQPSLTASVPTANPVSGLNGLSSNFEDNQK